MICSTPSVHLLLRTIEGYFDPPFQLRNLVIILGQLKTLYIFNIHPNIVAFTNQLAISIKNSIKNYRKNELHIKIIITVSTIKRVLMTTMMSLYYLLEKKYEGVSLWEVYDTYQHLHVLYVNI